MSHLASMWPHQQVETDAAATFDVESVCDT